MISMQAEAEISSIGEGCRSHSWTVGCEFLPLGLLWGVVAGGFHTYHIANMGSADDQVEQLAGPIGTIACTCPITALLGSAILKRELSSIRWVVRLDDHRCRHPAPGALRFSI